MIRKIVDVKAMDDHSLICEMENGEVFRYDMSFLKRAKGEVTKPLGNISKFKQVQIEYGALEWSSGYGIHGDTVARKGKLVSAKKTAA